jgi:small subunit ribosomal protein S5
MMADETTEVQGTEVQAGNPAVVERRAPADQQQQQRGVAAVAAAAAVATIAAAAIAAAARRIVAGGGNRGDDDGGEELIEKLVHINRVSKTVKGGKRFGFAALVVVGDGKGRSGFGHGKAREVPEAISKATAAAKKAMVRVPLKEGRTLHHDGNGHFGAGNVHVRTAPAGTGIIAGGPMRAVFESLGVADVVTKSIGTSNPYNMIRATFEALKDQTSPQVGGPAPRQEDRRPARPRRRLAADVAEAEAAGGHGVRTWRRSRSPRPAARSGATFAAKTLIGLGLNKMHRTVELRTLPRSAA